MQETELSRTAVCLSLANVTTKLTVKILNTYTRIFISLSASDGVYTCFAFQSVFVSLTELLLPHSLSENKWTREISLVHAKIQNLKHLRSLFFSRNFHHLLFNKMIIPQELIWC
jgi:hypothetical protein